MYRVLLLLFAVFFYANFQNSVFAASCVTISNNSWDCGTPSESDDLTVNHSVSITSDFNPTGNIIINSGGYLTITGNSLIKHASIIIEENGTLNIQGNAEFSSNSSVTCKGDIIFNNMLTIIETSANFVIQGGTVSSDGNILVNNGANLEVGVGSILFTHNSIEFNSNSITINGLVDSEGDFTNNKNITGTGSIQYVGACGGSGTINGESSSAYCESGTIDLASLGCGTDTEDPVISNMPTNITAYTAAGSCDASVNWSAPTTSDNCSMQSITSTHSSGDVFPVGTTLITYTATDAATNSTNASFNITVLDTISPTISNLPSDINQNSNAGACGAIVNWTLPSATDNCSASLSSSHHPGDFFNIGTTTVSYTALDIHGNSSILTFDVMINDNIPPSINNIPTDITQNADATLCGAIVNWTVPTATDNCSVSLSSSHHPGDFFNVGTTTVSYTALDIHGNSTVLIFDVMINDNITPVINNIPADITQNTDAGLCGAILNWTVPIATDNCSVSLSSSHHPGDFFNVGTTTVTYTALDTHGNSTFETFEIIVEDKNGPDFVSCPSLFIVESIDATSNKAIISWIEPTATEPCSYFTLSSNYKPGDSFSFGVTTIIYTATDGHGNESTCSFDVESGINNPPSIKSQYLSSKAGESINICLSAEDPDGDQVKIKTIRVNGEHATIEDVDSLALCFIYTSFNNFGRIDTVLVEIIDDGLPDMSAFTDVVIEVEREQNIYPSSALTPNGDGSNDIWIIMNIDLYSDNSVSIYDRWGSLIYNKAGYNNIRNVWDGRNTNGAIVPTGTYFYVINLDNDENITGPIEVIR